MIVGRFKEDAFVIAGKMLLNKIDLSCKLGQQSIIFHLCYAIHPGVTTADSSTLLMYSLHTTEYIDYKTFHKLKLIYE